jgi:F0F1-type ATP synthase membrane subunit b/b'
MKKLPMIRTRFVVAVLGFLLILGSVALAQRPRENVSRARHPNIAAAQRLCEQAWQRVVDAQQANEFDMQGHAQKAKELLDQANRELKLAAETANRNAR